MVSALTKEGADVTLEALELGAVDYMPKPERFQMTEMRLGGPLLIAKVLAAADSRVLRSTSSALREPRGAAESSPPRTPARLGPTDSIAVIGISTGGPQTLAAIAPELEPPLPPIVIVQHMPPRFTAVFAERLDRGCPADVKEAAEGDAVLPGRVLIAPGGRHLALVGRPPHVRVTLSDGPPVSGHRPSIDVLFRSAAQAYEAEAVGFLMTGMGRDGVDGCKAILAAGGATYGQDEPSSCVYGMNKAAYLEGAVRSQFAAADLPAILKPPRTTEDSAGRGRNPSPDALSTPDPTDHVMPSAFPGWSLSRASLGELMRSVASLTGRSATRVHVPSPPRRLGRRPPRRPRMR